MDHLLTKNLEQAIQQAVSDVSMYPKNQKALGHFIATAPGVVSGMQFVVDMYALKAPKVIVHIIRDDGTPISKGDVLLYLEGELRDVLLCAELTKHFIEHMSTIATQTAKYTYELAQSEALILAPTSGLVGINKYEEQAILDGGGCLFADGLEIINEAWLADSEAITSTALALREKNPDLTIAAQVQSLMGFMNSINSCCDLIIIDECLDKNENSLVKVNDGTKLLAIHAKITPAMALSYAQRGFDYLYLDYSLLKKQPQLVQFRIRNLPNKK